MDTALVIGIVAIAAAYVGYTIYSRLRNISLGKSKSCCGNKKGQDCTRSRG
jgi:hypothetical protein